MIRLVKITPKSQRAENRVREHGEEMEILLDRGDSIILRSLNQTFKYREGVYGKWVGTLTSEEADWKEI